MQAPKASTEHEGVALVHRHNKGLQEEHEPEHVVDEGQGVSTVHCLAGTAAMQPLLSKSFRNSCEPCSMTSRCWMGSASKKSPSSTVLRAAVPS
jgi:hypothetical protein